MTTEYFGLPGSGKTYLAERYSRAHGTRLIEARGYFERCLWAFIFFCIRPRVCSILLREIIKENKNNALLLRHKVRVLYLNTIAKEGKAFFSRKENIIDEGFAQAILSLYEREIHVDELPVFAELFHERNIYLITASDAMREERIRARARLPRAFLGGDYHSRWFSLLEKNHSIISAWIRQNFPHTEIRNE
ncbi:MAG: hypothetical protein HY445_02445 [Candidatus Niyogibacteria bacterium]|nr:hypothetical protein [Candidatus Niyogibacteria bacterium]